MQQEAFSFLSNTKSVNLSCWKSFSKHGTHFSDFCSVHWKLLENGKKLPIFNKNWNLNPNYFGRIGWLTSMSERRSTFPYRVSHSEYWSPSPKLNHSQKIFFSPSILQKSGCFFFWGGGGVKINWVLQTKYFWRFKIFVLILGNKNDF